MTESNETKLPQDKVKKVYEKPTVETEEVLERQVLGTGLEAGNPKCS